MASDEGPMGLDRLIGMWGTRLVSLTKCFWSDKTISADLGLKKRLSTKSRFYEMASDEGPMGLDRLIGTIGAQNTFGVRLETAESQKPHILAFSDGLL